MVEEDWNLWGKSISVWNSVCVALVRSNFKKINIHNYEAQNSKCSLQCSKCQVHLCAQQWKTRQWGLWENVTESSAGLSWETLEDRSKSSDLQILLSVIALERGCTKAGKGCFVHKNVRKLRRRTPSQSIHWASVTTWSWWLAAAGEPWASGSRILSSWGPRIRWLQDTALCKGQKRICKQILPLLKHTTRDYSELLVT